MPVEKTQTNDGGEESKSVQITILNGEKLSEMPTVEKIRYIIERVKENKIVILEEGLQPEEESRLVERTMSEIDCESFSGIEIESYPQKQKAPDGLVGRISSLGTKPETASLTVIGPSGAVKTINKDESVIEALIQTS